MVEKLPRILVEKQGSHSENPPKGIEVPIRDALARHGFTEGCWCMKVRMVHARGESHSYRGAHFKNLRNYARNVIDVVSQPGAAHTAFPARPDRSRLLRRNSRSQHRSTDQHP